MTPAPLLVVVAALAAGPKAPAPLPIRGAAVEFPSRDEARVTLIVPHIKGGPPCCLVAQRLSAGDVSLLVKQPPAFTEGDGVTRVSFTLSLAEAPAEVLALDPNRLPLRWEGLRREGSVLLAAEGTLDLGDRGEVELPVRRLQQLYTSVGKLSVAPGAGGIAVRALVGLYNPFAFDVVVTGVQLRVTVDGAPILEAKRPGFRLRGRQSSDVLVEQDVPLGQIAGGLASVMGGAQAELTGLIGIRTPNGERFIPLQAAGTF